MDFIGKLFLFIAIMYWFMLDLAVCKFDNKNTVQTCYAIVKRSGL